MGPRTKPWDTPYMSCDGDEDELLTEVDWYLSERYECSRLNAQNRVQAGEENLVVNSVKSGRKIQQKKNRNVVIVQIGETIVYNTYQNGLGPVSCWIGWLKGAAEVVFLEMGEKFVENDFFLRILDRNGRLEMGR